MLKDVAAKHSCMLPSEGDSGANCLLQLRLLTPSNMPAEDSLDGLAFATLLEDDGFDQWSQAPRGTVKLELALWALGVAGNHSWWMLVKCRMLFFLTKNFFHPAAVVDLCSIPLWKLWMRSYTTLWQMIICTVNLSSAMYYIEWIPSLYMMFHNIS